MPWTAKDAIHSTKKAKTPHLKRLWAKTANSVLNATDDEGRAIRIANAAVANAASKKKKRNS